MRRVFCLLVLWVGSFANAADRYDEFYGLTSFGQTTCALERIQAESAAYVNDARPDLPLNKVPDWRSCVRASIDGAKPEYQALLKTIRKPAAITAFKDYFIKFQMAMEGIAATPNERQFAYDRRQDELGGKVREAWLRFQAER